MNFRIIIKQLCASVFILSSVSAWAFQANQLVSDARDQIGKTLLYDPGYSALKYPMGDVPMIKGVCTDVVIRALRVQGIDLQQRIHEDMQKNFAAYPQKWGLKRPDKNIDHRRVPNIMTYFTRQGYQVKAVRTVGIAPINPYQAGDIVAWDLGKGLTHIGVISNKLAPRSTTPLVIHNIGYGTQENNILYQYKIIGHYRVPAAIR